MATDNSFHEHWQTIAFMNTDKQLAVGVNIW